MNKNLRHFSNDGFGWRCNACAKPEVEGKTVSRLLSEGEAESKSPELSGQALAKWSDAERKELICPVCGVIERLSSLSDLG